MCHIKFHQTLLDDPRGWFYYSFCKLNLNELQKKGFKSMVNGYTGPTVHFFRPAFVGCIMTCVIGNERLTGAIEGTNSGLKGLNFGGRRLDHVMDNASDIQLIKIPDFEDCEELVPAASSSQT
jgi:hypothetical protein